MTPQQLEHVYSRWTAQLHHWVGAELGRHIDCEYFPSSFEFRIYSGFAREGDIYQYHTVPTLHRPAGELMATVQLARPEDNPTQADLDGKFRELCLAAARVLEMDRGTPKLQDGHSDPEQPAPVTPHEPRRPRPVRARIQLRPRPKKRPPPGAQDQHG